MFTNSDVGNKKVHVLKRELLKRNENIAIETVSQKISNEEDMKSLPTEKLDLIVLSADSDGLIVLVNSFCIKENIPYVNNGYIDDIATVGPFVIPNKTGCFCCGDDFI